MSTSEQDVLDRIRLRAGQKQEEDKDRRLDWQEREIRRLQRQNLLLKRVNEAMLRVIGEFDADA